PVAERGGTPLVGHAQHLAHPRPGLDVPAPPGFQPRAAPDLPLLPVRARLVAPRDEWQAALADPGERRDDRRRAPEAPGIGRRADQDEVVVHDVASRVAVPLGQEAILAGTVVD